MGRTLAEKIWDAHVVRSAEGEPDLLYIDLHLLHEVTSPQAFDGLRAASRKVRRPDLTIATEDHNVPTTGITGPGVPPPTSPTPLYGSGSPFTDPVSRTQVEALRKNCAEFGIRLHPMGDADQGIVHVIGPQLGLTQPGLTIVCGDSHTSTHGALGALAFGRTPVPHPVLAGITGRQLQARRALRAEPATAHRRIRIALDLDDLLVLDVNVLPAAHRAVRADRFDHAVGIAHPGGQPLATFALDRRAQAEPVPLGHLTVDRP